MTPERWQRVKDVFAGAGALESAARERYLDDCCAEDAELRAEVVSLLAAHHTSDAILDRPASEYVSLGDVEPAVDPWIGRRIGAYELLAVLGHGGMGTVYRARRADAQYDKEVAIKLVRAGLDSAFVLQRFRAERQFLADLEHPNIARLLDAGATDGQPYLVMELVQGVPIDVYCREHQLGVPARL
ncbi:MAG TPA: protein kinase, partial [Candidatus Dormibacteraeota bacterium]|nr:protein kinase [Candidatus Dormibacteraeota bacterium]